MKLLFVLIVCLFIRLPEAAAYLDLSNKDEAQTSAGDQNTNLYKLNSITTVRIKQMRKIDEALARNPNYGGKAKDVMIEEILSDAAKQNQNAEDELKKILAATIARTKNKTALILKDADKFARLQAAEAVSVKDSDAAAALKQQLRRK